VPAGSNRHAQHMHPMHRDIMTGMANVQIRGVPDDVHRRLKSQAALAGQSLNEYLLARMSDLAQTLTWPELFAQIGEREPYSGPSTAELIREDRDQH
jgi:antitoxin FitA